jgi:hypothetical protein
MPIPGNGAVGVGTNPTLRWTRGRSATEYIVSLGTTYPPPEVDTVSGQTYSPTSLSPGTVYYWQVDPLTPEGTTEGETWTFRTVPEPGTWALLLPGVGALGLAARREGRQKTGRSRVG